jgi:hypothetical protein
MSVYIIHGPREFSKKNLARGLESLRKNGTPRLMLAVGDASGVSAEVRMWCRHSGVMFVEANPAYQVLGTPGALKNAIEDAFVAGSTLADEMMLDKFAILVDPADEEPYVIEHFAACTDRYGFKPSTWRVPK